MVAPAASAALEAIEAALLSVLLSMVAVTALWGITFLVEHKVGRLSAKRIRRIGIGIAMVVTVLVAAGGMALDRSTTGGVGTFVSARWHEVVSDTGPAGSSETRFAALSLNGRAQLWRMAAAAFRERPLTGLGADNYEPYSYEHRKTAVQGNQAHEPAHGISRAELGLPGMLLWAALVLLALVQGVRGRSRPRTRPCRPPLRRRCRRSSRGSSTRPRD